MTWWQILLIGFGGLFLKYCISMALCNNPWKEDILDKVNENEKEYNRYIEQSNRAVQKCGKIFENIETEIVVENGMSLLSGDGFSITCGEV